MVFAEERHPAYDHLDAKKIMGQRNGTQVGDPKKGGKAIYELAVLQDPPLRVVIGSDAYKVLLLQQCFMKKGINLYRRLSWQRLKHMERIIRNTRRSPTVPTLKNRPRGRYWKEKIEHVRVPSTKARPINQYNDPQCQYQQFLSSFFSRSKTRELERSSHREVPRMQARERLNLTVTSSAGFLLSFNGLQPIGGIGPNSTLSCTLKVHIISARVSLTAAQTRSVALRTPPGKGPFSIILTLSRICSTLLAPRIIPSSSLSAE